MDFAGQTIIVTGANTGLGLEAARHLSRLNASHIILAVRTLSKGVAAKESILSTFVAKANKLPRLDAVLENAGIMSNYFKMVGRFEAVITTNVISTFLLALLILPKLRETAVRFNVQPRLSIVASDMHYLANFPERDSPDIFGALNKEEGAVMGSERYAVSKLLEVLTVRELGTRTQDPESKSPQIIINCMTPGLCSSEFDRESRGFVKFLTAVTYSILARTPEVGARALVAGLEGGEESNGNYMADCVVADPSPFVRSEEGEQVQKRVWTQLLEQLEKIQPGISQNVNP